MQNHKTQIELIAAEWRQRAKEVVYPLAMRLEGRWLVAVEPIWRERVGDRVLWYYVKGAVDMLLYLEQAGDGRRSVRLEICRLPPQQCKMVNEEARKTWAGSRFTVRQVERWLEALELTSGGRQV
ncbi:MAG: hypothetical protein ACO2PN_09760 [Pyrobaculum sp.]|jgi:hypothetical protein